MGGIFSTVTKELFFAFLKYTLPFFGLTLLFSLPLGLLISFASMSRFKIISRITQCIVWVVRGVPLMLLVMILVYVPGMNNIPTIIDVDKLSVFMPREWAYWFSDCIPIIIAFVINYSCYFSEIFRGGIESINKGQYEAGQVLGMTRTQTFFKVVLLQVVKRILPPMSNEVMTLIKDTALANAVSVSEVIFTSYRMMSTYQVIWPLFYSAIFYLAAVGVFTLLFKFFEKKLNYFKA